MMELMSDALMKDLGGIIGLIVDRGRRFASKKERITHQSYHRIG
jgi:hypothetical protein